MSTITATSSIVQPPLTVQASAGTPPTGFTATSIPSDAVVISISKGTLSASAHPSDTAAEQRVDSLVDEVKTHNDIADLNAHVDWSAAAKIIGQDKVDAIRNQSEKYLAYSTAHISREFGESGINVQPVTNKQATQSGIAPGSLLVGDFSFKSGGSTYAVTSGNDGTLVGTKDGQAWKTWRTTPTHITLADTNSAETALSTLKSLTDQLRSNTDDQNSLPVLRVTV